MKNGMVIIDADGHAVDAEPVYRERLPERYRKRNFIYPSDGFDRNQNGTISKRPDTPAQNLADNDRAIGLLERAYTERQLAMTEIANVPAFDPLRSDERFIALLRRVGVAK